MTQIIGKDLKMTGKALKTAFPSLNASTLAKAICAAVIAIAAVFFRFQTIDLLLKYFLLQFPYSGCEKFITRRHT
jgi:hypothetical protein